MIHSNFSTSLALCATLSLGVCTASEVPDRTEAAVWEHHHELISYYGVTASYTCAGIEDRMRQVLVYFGARPDLRVSARCTSQFAPMHQIFVQVDFDSLAPTGSRGGNEIAGHWLDLHIMPSDPLFRDRGDCELFQDMKDVLIKDFSARDMRYDTYCTPNQTTLMDYKISGQVLAPPDLRRVALR